MPFHAWFSGEVDTLYNRMACSFPVSCGWSRGIYASSYSELIHTEVVIVKRTKKKKQQTNNSYGVKRNCCIF